jgi:hypothetical protein
VSQYSNTDVEEGLVDAILLGGPVDIAEAVRRRRVAVTDERIKICHRGGYEHFERDNADGAPGGQRPVVYHWTMHTRIAE